MHHALPRKVRKIAAKPRREVGVGSFRISPRAKRYLNRVIASNRISYGRFSERLERAFARAHGCRYAVFCNSGTSALQVALQALREEHGWPDGGEVLVPAVSFPATVNIVLHNRMVPVFVDVDPLTYNMDPAQMKARITSRTKAVIPVHLMGLPCDMDPILSLAAGHGLEIIEDSCETVFGSYKGQPVGSMGAIGCFSTYVAHYVVTGVGGFALTNDEKLAFRLRSLINHGRDPAYFQIDDDGGLTGAGLHEVVSKRFSFVSVGHSFRCTEFEAALGLAQLEEKRAIVSARRDNARALSAGLKDLSDVLQLPAAAPGVEHMYMLYPLVLRDGEKTGLVNHLEDHGIETRALMPLLNQPVYQKLFGDLEPDYPVARWLNRSGFYIGCHQYLTRGDIDYTVKAIRDFFKR